MLNDFFKVNGNPCCVKIKQWPLARYSRRLTRVLAKKRLASTRKHGSTSTCSSQVWVRQNGLANVGKSGESAQNGLANVGESGESRKYVSTGPKCTWSGMSFYAQKTYFICIKPSILHSPNSQDSPNSTNLPNSCNTCQTCLREYPIFIILAKLASREYLFFQHTRQTWLTRVPIFDIPIAIEKVAIFTL
jgi:hypothetical protein